MKICSHTLVRNESMYVWYAIESMINHVDFAKVWDMDSTDNTFEIIKELKKKYTDKIEVKKVTADPKDFTNFRQKMLNETKQDWVIILDGDEVWWDDQAKLITDTIRNNGDKIETIVSKYINLIGDIYHFQEEKASHYNIDGISGSLTIRAFNTKIEGIHYDKPHGIQGIYDKDGCLIQERNKKYRFHLGETAYLHFTHLQRSTNRESDNNVYKRGGKYKFELGNSFPADYYYPEVFFRKRPEIVPSVWKNRNIHYTIRAAAETVPKKLRRRYFKLKEGY